ncbi:plasmid mobilization protein [Pseudomonas sihuiensis]|uniref:Uncharacterized protein n=1 Tax=Pseudomonas sihuiensis TaxID=1274359 RepID=A0A1H2LIV4_9PSED|nr:hypothetical protein [Pseudomonas sihuiensis]SDU80963.1 hypothetical protein SAMN05216363_1675 [Pseudomonas sihuiensis]
MTIENKKTSLTIRLTQEEKYLAKAKADRAGYKTLSAFFRDYVINEDPKEKISIPPDTFEIMSALTQLSAEINRGTTRPLASELISKISKNVMGN